MKDNPKATTPIQDLLLVPGNDSSADVPLSSSQVSIPQELFNDLDTEWDGVWPSSPLANPALMKGREKAAPKSQPTDDQEVQNLQSSDDDLVGSGSKDRGKLSTVGSADSSSQTFGNLEDGLPGKGGTPGKSTSSDLTADKQDTIIKTLAIMSEDL